MSSVAVAVSDASSDPAVSPEPDVTTWRGATPLIPASRLDPVAEDDGVLLWVRQGELTVTVGEGPTGRTLVARSGEAVWLPPGTRHSARLPAGSVALPIMVEVAVVPETLALACVVALPASWGDWLVYRVSRWFGFTSGARPDRASLLDLLVEVGPAGRTAPRPRGSTLPPLPPLPRTAGPRAVVERLIRHPANDASLAELAAAALISPRTLQRRLSEETGASLAQWRTAVRVAAGAGHLAQGRDIGWTAHQVGYESVSGFAHAFAERVGVSPGRYAASSGAGAGERPADPIVHDLVGLVHPLSVISPERGDVSPSAAPPAPAIPAVPSSSWVAAIDSVLWVYRGTVTVEVADRRWLLEAGDVLWLPHGTPHRIAIAAESILLPLGWRPATRPMRMRGPHVVRTPRRPELELFLLHTLVANHFLLRPPGHDEQSFLDLLRPPAGTVPEALPPHVEAIVTAVIDDPADRRSLAQWAWVLHIDAVALGRDFAATIGEPFPSWRAKARMTEARALLRDGVPPSSVARRLGYTHLSTFSRAFAAAHGMPPREWLRRDAG